MFVDVPLFCSLLKAFVLASNCYAIDVFFRAPTVQCRREDVIAKCYVIGVLLHCSHTKAGKKLGKVLCNIT